ncbi:guanine nucleotide-binding protein subunit gamma 2-like [Alnus glutinosa]|uniref:guanine nucleotide-binding protein subunit gamma 2-like n=1 Tax=Alnus glutinosa TaxID=3517 RepID=UPI002D7A2DF9|nr:guanine nucleotide-binding protein subunit gamma 2-like [Alnus glutinosa]
MDVQQQSQPSSSSSPGGGRGGAKQKEVVSPDHHHHHPQGNAKAGASGTFFGKHRMAAAITNLHSQINILQEELDKLETTGESSVVCKELISSLGSVRDPLLPSTRGPEDVSWDRWFRGAHNSRNHKRWM